jgi:hypothetical protein
MFAVLFFVFWIRIYQNELVAFEEYVLDIQSNYASDSAIDELLVASDLNQDYANGDFVTLEPSLAEEDFAHTLCLDFGYIPTDSTLELVKNNNIRALLVCTYDGIYAYYMMQTETHSYELKQTPKIPYFYTDPDTNTQYCLTLDENKGYWDYYDASGNYKLHKYDYYDNKPTKDLQLTAINEQVADVLNWVLYESYSGGDSDLTVSIPALSETVRGEQPVNAPTVLAVIDGNIKVFSTTITAESIGGSQLEETNQVIGYTLKNAPIYKPYTDSNGVVYYGDEALAKWKASGENSSEYIETTLSGTFYAYSSWWQSHSYMKSGGYISKGQYFDSVFEAAKNGYNDLNTCN